MNFLSGALFVSRRKLTPIGRRRKRRVWPRRIGRKAREVCYRCGTGKSTSAVCLPCHATRQATRRVAHAGDRRARCTRRRAAYRSTRHERRRADASGVDRCGVPTGSAARRKGPLRISPEVCERALEIAIRENALEVAAALAVAEEAQSVHQGALRVLERELLTTPFMELAKADAASPDASVGHRPKLALALAHRPVLARRVTWVTLIGSNFTIT